MSNVVHQYCSDFVANSLMHSVLFAVLLSTSFLVRKSLNGYLWIFKNKIYYEVIFYFIEFMLLWVSKCGECEQCGFFFEGRNSLRWRF